MRIFRIFLFVLTIITCSSISASSDKWVKYKNREFKFKFEYPEEWEVGFGTGTQTIYVSWNNEPREYTENLSFSLISNFYVDVAQKKELSLEEIGNNYDSLITNNSTLKNGQIISRRELIFREYNALEFIGTAEFMGMTSKWKIIMFQTANYYFELCSTTQLEKFDKMKSTIDRTFESFKLLGN
ncbi:MAG: hypothetical protein HYZ14_03395 [Bacteroidetes bacterium]|nr:hypothetical protein [Bacteroidota bacterium]